MKTYTILAKMIERIKRNFIWLLSINEYWQLKKTGVRIDEYIDYARIFKNINDIDLIIDVGANRGQFAKIFRYFYPSTQIYAFEPLPEVFRYLETTFLDDSMFKGLNIALSNNDGTASIMKNESSAMASFLKLKRRFTEFGDVEETGFMEIPTARLDSIGLKFENGLLKLDVQGFEKQVLEGAQETLNYVKYILIEVSFIEIYSNQDLFHDIYEYLTRRGFDYVWAFNQNISKDINLPIQQDALFIRSCNH